MNFHIKTLYGLYLKLDQKLRELIKTDQVNLFISIYHLSFLRLCLYCFFFIHIISDTKILLIDRFLNILVPENLSDEIRVLNEYGGETFDTIIDSNLRKLLDETKD